jgi:CubicO group peptidase (beta-lactamase class C family)
MLDDLASLAGESEFSGVVSVRREGEILFRDAFGHRDVANRLPNNTETRFGIASGTKTFTAVAILRLVESGALKLSTRAASLFDEEVEFIHPDATILDLLCHRSGIYDYFDEELITEFDTYEVDIPWFKLATPSDYLPLFRSRRPKFAPAGRCSYSNGGYVFLGIIAEKVSGQLFRRFVAQEVLQPAGMSHSGFFAFNELPGNTATGYISTEGSGRSNIYQLPIRGGGDGGMFTTAGDLHSFWDKLTGGHIISPELLDRMRTEESVLDNSTAYGLGVYLRQFNGHPAMSASGMDAGVGFTSTCVPGMELDWSVLSNTSEGATAISRHIVRNLKP